MKVHQIKIEIDTAVFFCYDGRKKKPQDGCADVPGEQKLCEIYLRGYDCLTWQVRKGVRKLL